MTDSFVFYDLETTGISSSKDRILQFAAQRTDMNLNLVGEPIDIKFCILRSRDYWNKLFKG